MLGPRTDQGANAHGHEKGMRGMKHRKIKSLGGERAISTATVKPGNDLSEGEKKANGKTPSIAFEGNEQGIYLSKTWGRQGNAASSTMGKKGTWCSADTAEENRSSNTHVRARWQMGRKKGTSALQEENS